MRLESGIVAWAFLAATACAQPTQRFVVIVGQPTDPRVTQQRAELERASVQLDERDVVIQDITPATARHDRPELGVSPQATFQVLLVGKDGGVKLRRDAPLPAVEITALIDTMPMRQAEMRR